MLDGAEKKIKDLKDGHKNDLKALQDKLDKVKNDAKAASEAHEKELSRLKTNKDNIQHGKDSEWSNAFSLGFKAYLENFLAADSDYDWAPHFPPSTFAYMIQFKVDNVASIEKAKVSLQARIAKELEAKAKGDDKQHGQEGENEETHVASPSQTVGTRLYELFYYCKYFGSAGSSLTASQGVIIIFNYWKASPLDTIMERGFLLSSFPIDRTILLRGLIYPD